MERTLTQLEDELVRQVKASSEELQRVRFVRAYNGREREMPFESPLVTVETGKTEIKPIFGGHRAKTQIIFNIYVPMSFPYSKLFMLMVDVFSGIVEADMDNLEDTIYISRPAIDKSYLARYHTIVAEINHSVTAEGNDE